MALVSDLSDLSNLSDPSDLSDKVGAPVFALTGYAVASHVIPRGFAVPLWGGARVGRVTVGVIIAHRRTNHLTNLIILIILTSATRWV